MSVAKDSATVHQWLEVVIGLIIGIATYLGAIGIGHLFLKMTNWNNDVVKDRKKSTPIQWFAEMSSIVLLIGSPWIAWNLAKATVTMIGK